MTTTEKCEYALLLAKQGKLAEARNILLLVGDERSWNKFSKIWRGE